MGIEDPLVDEGTPLLVVPAAQTSQQDVDGGNERDSYPSSSIETSAAVIERTNVLFYPDFCWNDEDDLGSSLGGGGRRNRIAVVDSDSITRRCSSGVNKQQGILEESGIARISAHSSTTRFTNARAMIGTITAASILNMVLATPFAGGLGMMLLPGSYAILGWLEGLLLFFAVGLLSVASLVLLHWISPDTAASYDDIVDDFLGRPGSLLLELSILLSCVGQLVAYIGYISAQMASFFNMDGIEAYQKADGLCGLSPEAGQHATSDRWITLLQQAPLFLFFANTSVAFVPVSYQQRTCTNKLLSSVTTWSLQAPSPEAILSQESSLLIWTSVIMAWEVYFFGTLVAYAAYCDDVPENLLDLWPSKWIPGLLARLFVVLEVVVLSAGICVARGRAALWRLLTCGSSFCNHGGALLGKIETVATTFCLAVIATVGSVKVDGAITLPLAVTGAVCGTTQMFVLPGLCALSLLWNGSYRCWGILLDLAFVLAGILFGLLSLFALLEKYEDRRTK